MVGAGFWVWGQLAGTANGYEVLQKAGFCFQAAVGAYGLGALCAIILMFSLMRALSLARASADLEVVDGAPGEHPGEVSRTGL